VKRAVVDSRMEEEALEYPPSGGLLLFIYTKILRASEAKRNQNDREKTKNNTEISQRLQQSIIGSSSSHPDIPHPRLLRPPAFPPLVAYPPLSYRPLSTCSINEEENKEPGGHEEQEAEDDEQAAENDVREYLAHRRRRAKCAWRARERHRDNDHRHDLQE
jgi:hypothetical protein